MQRINIIKYIEEKENKDIWDYKKIIIKSTLSMYEFNKNVLGYFEVNPKSIFVHGFNKVEIRRKSQIHNRIQYIKQSGYEFKEYMVNDDILTIVFE